MININLISTGESEITIGQLQCAVYDYYLSVYQVASDTDKMYGTNILEPTHMYTYATDMVTCLIFDNISMYIDKYIDSMLNKSCKGNVQAYFEMILSTMVMSKFFAELGQDIESRLCSRWHTKLLFDVYSDYVTEEEISNIWRLR